jgi:hypothetical protein
MRPVDADHFSIVHEFHIGPNHFLVTKTQPSIVSTFNQKGIQRSTLGSLKKRFAGD